MAKLDPGLERKRRRRILFAVVPQLLDRHLRPLLGAGRFSFIASMFLKVPGYRRRFRDVRDDHQLRRVKSTFLLIGVLYNELVAKVGEQQALKTTQEFLYDLACEVQRQAYFPPDAQSRSWEYFHGQHEAQMAEGFISTNENDGVRHYLQRVELNIVRCRFHECFHDMGNAAITEAFCRSDETVFNEYSPEMKFHRGESQPDTIARGGQRCVFIYERAGAHWELVRRKVAEKTLTLPPRKGSN